jgi:hypothetical protein
VVNNTYDARNLVSIAPRPYYKDDVGVIDSFSAEDGLAQVRFDRKNLYDRVLYNFTVICTHAGDIDQYSALVTPVYNELQSVPTFFVFVRDNMSYLIALLLVAVLIAGFVVFMKKVIL